jgi:hypothetical protein
MNSLLILRFSRTKYRFDLRQGPVSSEEPLALTGSMSELPETTQSFDHLNGPANPQTPSQNLIP